MMGAFACHAIVGILTTKNPCWCFEAKYHCYTTYKPIRLCHTFKLLFIVCWNQSKLANMYIHTTSYQMSSLATSKHRTTTTSQPIFYHYSKPLWLHPITNCLTCAHTTNNHRNEVSYVHEVFSSICHPGHKKSFFAIEEGK